MKPLSIFAALLLCIAVGAPSRAHAQDAYTQSQSWHRVLSASDQSQFDKYYSKWVDATRKNDQDDIIESARKMQEIMARYNIPSTVQFAQVASGGNVAGYPNPAYAPVAQGQRLSSSDQHEFDEAYKKWLKARHKKNPDDIEKSARRMQDIMARYNIPANVPYDQIASADASYK